MNRKEIFEIIKKNSWNKEIRDTFGKNMTQVSDENLSMFITDKGITEQAEKTNKKQEKEKERKKEETSAIDINCRKAIISMLSCFEASNYLTNEEVEKVLKELK